MEIRTESWFDRMVASGEEIMAMRDSGMKWREITGARSPMLRRARQWRQNAADVCRDIYFSPRDEDNSQSPGTEPQASTRTPASVPLRGIPTGLGLWPSL